MANHSSILAWKITWTVGYSSWGLKELVGTEQLTLSLSGIIIIPIWRVGGSLVLEQTNIRKFHIHAG